MKKPKSIPPEQVIAIQPPHSPWKHDVDAFAALKGVSPRDAAVLWHATWQPQTLVAAEFGLDRRTVGRIISENRETFEQLGSLHTATLLRKMQAITYQGLDLVEEALKRVVVKDSALASARDIRDFLSAIGEVGRLRQNMVPSDWSQSGSKLPTPTDAEYAAALAALPVEAQITPAEPPSHDSSAPDEERHE